jgi:hypothetical protein
MILIDVYLQDCRAQAMECLSWLFFGVEIPGTLPVGHCPSCVLRSFKFRLAFLSFVSDTFWCDFFVWSVKLSLALAWAQAWPQTRRDQRMRRDLDCSSLSCWLRSEWDIIPSFPFAKMQFGLTSLEWTDFVSSDSRISLRNTEVFHILLFKLFSNIFERFHIREISPQPDDDRCQ